MKGEHRTLNRRRRDRMICQPHLWTRYTVLRCSMFFTPRVVYCIAGYALLRVIHRIKWLLFLGIETWDPPSPFLWQPLPPTPVPGSDGGWNDDQICWRYQLTIWIVKWYLGGGGGRGRIWAVGSSVTIPKESDQNMKKKKILHIYLRCHWSSYHPWVSNIFAS